MQHPTSVPRLNYDVLLDIFPYLPPHDISSVMKTCRDLYRPAIPFILDPRPWRAALRMSDPRMIHSFYTFMSARPWNGDRIRYLTRLCIGTNRPSEGVVSEVAQIVRMAVNLEELTLESLEDMLRVGGSVVMETFCDLHNHHNLKKLSVSYIRSRSEKMLSNVVSSSIVDLSLSFDSSMDFPDPSMALRNLRNTIEILTLESCYPELMDAPCPRVHTLSIRTSFPLTTLVFVRLFPNLRKLDPLIECAAMDEEEVGDRRRENQADLERNNASWPDLKYVRGDPIHLFILCLSCHVYELEFQPIASEEIDETTQLLADLTPRMVHLPVDLKTFSPADLTEFLDEALLNCGDCCTHLSLRLVLTKDIFDIDRLPVSRHPFTDEQVVLIMHSPSFYNPWVEHD